MIVSCSTVMVSELVNNNLVVTVYACMTHSMTLFHTSYDSNMLSPN